MRFLRLERTSSAPAVGRHPVNHLNLCLTWGTGKPGWWRFLQFLALMNLVCECRKHRCCYVCTYPLAALHGTRSPRQARVCNKLHRVIATWSVGFLQDPEIAMSVLHLTGVKGTWHANKRESGWRSVVTGYKPPCWPSLPSSRAVLACRYRNHQGQLGKLKHKHLSAKT